MVLHIEHCKQLSQLVNAEKKLESLFTKAVGFIADKIFSATEHTGNAHFHNTLVQNQ